MRNRKGYKPKKDTRVAGGPSFEIRPIEPDAPRMRDADSIRIWDKFTKTPKGAELKQRAREVGKRYSI